MYHFVFLTTMIAASQSAAQTEPPPQERLVPIPQGAATPYIAEKPSRGESAPPAANESRPDVILQWNTAILNAIKAERTPPPRAARNLAMVHAAIYDAVNALDRTHRPYRVDARVQGAASAEVAAAIAAHRILIELYPRQAEPCDAALDAALENVPDGSAKQGGVALGQHVAEKILAWRANDGAERRVEYAPRVAPGVWRPTPPRNRQAMLPQWRYLTPFAIPSAARFVPATPPPLTSAAYTEAFHEVKELGGRASSKRTEEQTLIAWFWDDGEGSVTPPGHWNQIAQIVSRQRGLSLAENARLFALLNISLADAAIVCWEGKFGYSYWRPITAIHEADRDDNPDTAPDRTWDSLLTTPPFPSYGSGHSTFSGAGAAALSNFFGEDALSFRIGSDGVPRVTRSFPGFWAAAQEAGRSRIYGGIHYEFDNQEGLRTGRDLADYIARHFLRPVREDARTSSQPSPPLGGEGRVRGSAYRHPFSVGLAGRQRVEPRSTGRGR